MNQTIKMKSVGPATELPRAEDGRAALADQYLQQNGYLPPGGDQSWRELAALRIAPGRDDNDEEMPDGLVPARQNHIPATDSGGRGRLVIPLLMLVVIVPIVVVLTMPDILTAAVWGTHHSSAATTPEPANPARIANIPAPLRTSLPKAPPTAQAPAVRPPAAPSGAGQDLNSGSVSKDASGPVPQAVPPPETAPVPKMAAVPKSQSAGSGAEAAQDRGTSFRTLVLGPDGSLRYQYFSDKPNGHSAKSDKAEAENGDGFYAMVADPDGTLRYRYFPSKPSR